MRIARVAVNGRIFCGRLEGETLHPFREDSVEDLTDSREPIQVSGARILPPCRPGKIIGVGRNYREHARERSKPLPDEPLLFLKPPSAAIGHGTPILLPPGIGRVDYEAELAIVIGRTASRLPVALAGQAVLGYTCFNDVTARDLQNRETQFTRAKGFDTFAPFGPWIETELDPSDLAISSTVNGEVRQSARTREMVFSVSFLVAFVSRVMTLHPGDLISTGTPAGIGALQAGDTVTVTVEGIGSLSNPVKEREPA